jgi:hypothetical protein
MSQTPGKGWLWVVVEGWLVPTSRNGGDRGVLWVCSHWKVEGLLVWQVW